MASVNKWIGIGNLGKDPESRTFANGDKVVSVSIATTEKWKDKQTGEPKELTEWTPLMFTGKLADIAEQYLKKGSQIYVEGSIRTRKWQDKEGNDRYTTEVRVGSMQMLGGKTAGDQPAKRAAAPAQGSGFEDMDSDIPF